MKYGKAKRYRPNTRKPIRRKTKRMASKKRNIINPSWYPFGRSRTVRLKYHETITINPALGSIGTYVFSANGLYDTNISGTGHQPYGFDQMCALYNHYYVTGSRIKVTPIENTNNPYYIFGVKLSDSTTLNTSTPDYLMEQPGLRKRIVSNSVAMNNSSVSCNFSCKKFFRLKSKAFILADDTMSGSASANPAEQAYFIIVCGPAVGSFDVAETTFQVEISYVATFTGPKELVVS